MPTLFRYGARVAPPRGWFHSSHFCGVFAVAQGNTHEFSVSVSVKRCALCSGTFRAVCIPIPLQVARALLANADGKGLRHCSQNRPNVFRNVCRDLPILKENLNWLFNFASSDCFVVFSVHFPGS